MPAVEIDEDELKQLQTLRTQVGSILKSPAARKKLAAAVKDVNPKDPLAAEADAVDPIEAKFAEMEKQLAAERKAREDAEAKRTQDAKLGELSTLRSNGIARLRQDKWTDAGITAVEKLMEEKGILDPLDAAAIYEKQHPPAMPIVPSTSSGSWDFMAPPAETETDMKALIESKGESVPLVDKMAWGAIQEVRGASPRR